MKNIKIIFSGSLLLFLFACGNESENSSTLSEKGIDKLEPVFVNLNIDKNKYQLENAEKGGEIELSNGTKLLIPSQAFIDDNGNPVKGKVEFNYREFRDAADIIISGIPMAYDSGGVENNLLTAGMFDLQGVQNKKPIFIAPGKELIVKMVSDVSDAPYNFYEFDTAKGNWNYIEPCVEEFASSVEQETIIDENFPIAPKPYDPKGYLLDFKINVNAYPELASIKNLTWQYAGDKPENDIEKNDWIFNQRWINTELVVVDRQNSVFKLNLKNNEYSHSLLIKPVATGKTFEDAIRKYDERKAEYEKKLAAISSERKQAAGFVTRTLGITQFGLYNCDRIYRTDAALFVKAEIVTDNNEFNLDENAVVYLVTGGSRTAYRLPKQNWNQLRFVPQDDNALVAVLPNNKVAVFKKEDFKKISKEELAKGVYKFRLETQPEEVISAEVFRGIINS